MAYVLNPTPSQNSVTEFLREQYPHVLFIPDGLMDDDNYDADGNKIKIPTFPSGQIKPFVVLWFGNARRTARHRGFTNSKLDSYTTGTDLVVVARSGTEARTLLNDIGNTILDFKPENSGPIVKGSALWRDARAVIDSQSRPTRFATTDRFEWGFQHNKTI